MRFLKSLNPVHSPEFLFGGETELFFVTGNYSVFGSLAASDDAFASLDPV